MFERVPDAGAAVDRRLDGGSVVPVDEVDVKSGSGKEHLEIGDPELGGSGEAGVEGGERSSVIALDEEGGGEAGVEIGGPEKGGVAIEGGGGAEEVESAEEDVFEGGNGADEVVTAGEEGVGCELEGEGGGEGG